MTKAQGIKLRDGEHSHAALGASYAAHQPLAATTRNVGERRIDDLHQLFVFAWELRQHHAQA